MIRILRHCHHEHALGFCKPAWLQASSTSQVKEQAGVYDPIGGLPKVAVLDTLLSTLSDASREISDLTSSKLQAMLKVNELTLPCEAMVETESAGPEISLPGAPEVAGDAPTQAAGEQASIEMSLPDPGSCVASMAMGSPAMPAAPA